MEGSEAKPRRADATGAATPATPAAADEEEVAFLAKRHRVSPAIVREIVRRAGTTERAAIEREIRRGKARR